MKIGILASWRLDDPSAWSGVIMPAVTAIGKEAEIVPLQIPAVNDSFFDRALTRFFGQRDIVYLPSDAFFSTVKKFFVVRSLLKNQKFDAVISLAASKESLGVPRYIPLVQVTDSSFSAMVEGYFRGKKVSRLSLIQGRILDRLVARKSAHYCVASQWSANRLVRDTGVSPEDITVVPFGPGVIPPEGIRGEKSLKEGISLLFIGSDWKRKGGYKALECFACAHARRPELKLTVVGAPEETPLEGVTYLPRQSKAELSALYASHDVLLEPTEASAGGVVVTDALNHGLPVISTRVGGIPTLVQDGVSGWLVSCNNSVQEITTLLLNLTQQDLAKASFSAYEDAQMRLTWESWAQKVTDVCKELAERRKS